jgi:hypothetical protein
MSTLHIPCPSDPGSVIVRLPRSKVVGPVLDDEISEAELKALDTQLRAAAISHGFKDLLAGTRVRIEEFDF